jgi:hypothetical protein
MDIKQVKIGKPVNYEAKNSSGTGKVFAIDQKTTGQWVCVNDAEQRRYVTVRPSQLTAVAR